MLTDFGLSKNGIKEKQWTHTFCGSISYIAPEMLTSKGYNMTVDWYLLGVLFYEMLTGKPPYYYDNVIYDGFDNVKLSIPNYISESAKKLIISLLEKDPNKRLGALKDIEDIKNHVFFKGIDWDKVKNKQYKPPPLEYEQNEKENIQNIFFEDDELFIEDNDKIEDDEINDKKKEYRGWNYMKRQQSQIEINNKYKFKK